MSLRMTNRHQKVGESGDSTERPGSGRQYTQDQDAEKFLTGLQKDPDLIQRFPGLSTTVSALLATRQKVDLVISLPVKKRKGTEHDEEVPQEYRIFNFSPVVSFPVKELLLSTMKKARREADDFQLPEDERVRNFVTDIRWALGQIGVIQIEGQVTSSMLHSIEERFNHLVVVPPDVGESQTHKVFVEGGNALTQRAKLASFHHEASKAKESEDKSKSSWYWHVNRVRRGKKEQVAVPYIEDFCDEVYTYFVSKYEREMSAGQRRFLMLAVFDHQSFPSISISHQGESFEKSLKDLIYSYVMYAYRLSYLKVFTSDFLWLQTIEAIKTLIGKIPDIDDQATVVPASLLRKIQDNVQEMISQDPILSGALTIYRRYPDDRERRYRNPRPDNQ